MRKGRDGFCLVMFILKGSVLRSVCAGDSATGWEPDSTLLGASRRRGKTEPKENSITSSCLGGAKATCKG